MDAHRYAALVRAGRPPRLDLSDPYGATMYRNTKSWPDWWRRKTFGDDVIDAEQSGQQAIAEKQRADGLQETVDHLEKENRRLRMQLANQRRPERGPRTRDAGRGRHE